MINYFDIFGLKEKVEIDLDLLEEKYHEFQRNFHPDKAGVTEIEKSMAFNEGYEILKDEFSRIAHLLQINNIDIKNDAKAPKVDIKVLQEIMLLQEKILESDENEKKQLKNELMTKIEQNLTETKEFFAKKDFENAAQKLMKVKYLKKTLKDLKKL